MGVDSDKAVWTAETNGIALLECTVGDMLDKQARDNPARLAIVFDEPPFGSAVLWTYAELKEHADRLAKGLIALGIERGARVAVLAPNSPEWLLLEYALAKIGAVLVTVNTAYKQSELLYLLGQGTIHTLFTVAEFRAYSVQNALDPALESATLLPHLKHVVLIGPGVWDRARTFESVIELGVGIPDDELRHRQATVSPQDVSQIQYTSGTTGAPKGAMLTHFSTLNNARLMSERAGFDANDRTISAMPFFHTAGCVCNVLGVLVSGGCLVSMAAFDAGRMLAQIAKHRVTIINAVPTMFIRLLEEPAFREGRVDCSSVRIAFTGGTTIAPELMRELRDRLDAEPMIIMGMTETSPIITQTVNDDDFECRIGTAGKPLPHTEVRIVDPNGDPVACGEPGELQIRGYLVTQSYFGLPEKTSSTFDDDKWFRSGDLAVLEKTGHLRIVGRLKDMIIRGGENLYPAEIEDFLVTHPAVSQAQVVGVKDPEMGEEAFAFVVLRPETTVSEGELRAFCRERISRHKVPRYFRFVDEMPLTASGKIKKFELRETASELVRR